MFVFERAMSLKQTLKSLNKPWPVKEAEEKKLEFNNYNELDCFDIILKEKQISDSTTSQDKTQ